MSRSRKKVPIIGIASSKANCHRKAKKHMTKQTRLWLDVQEEMPQNATYKKLMHSYKWRPDDGKHYYNEPKAYRK